MAGRPRGFDEEVALDAAIEHFWRRGYLAASIRDLSDEMQIGGASLYNAFNDKQTLFLRALQRYLDKSARRSIAELDAAADPVAALHDFFARLIKASLADRRGCMLVNSVMELGPRDDALGAAVRSGLREVERGFRRAIANAQRLGIAPRHLDASVHARHLLGTMIAVRALARIGADAGQLRDMAAPSLAQLGHAAAPAHDEARRRNRSTKSRRQGGGN